MADVFVSYQKRDRALAQRVVNALSQSGYSVWWDDRLTPAERWDRMIERELLQAKCVLVLWTPRSVESEWVRIEANAAKGAKPPKLVQARFEQCELPIAFSLTQFADVAERDLGTQSDGWIKVVEWVQLYAGQPEQERGAIDTPSGATALRSQAPAASRDRPWLAYVALVVTALLAGGLRAYAATGGPMLADLAAADRAGMFIGARILFYAGLAIALIVSSRLNWWRAIAFAIGSFLFIGLASTVLQNPFVGLLRSEFGLEPHLVSVASQVLGTLLSIVFWVGAAWVLGAFARPRDLTATLAPILFGALLLPYSVASALMFDGAFDRATVLGVFGTILSLGFVLSLFTSNDEI